MKLESYWLDTAPAFTGGAEGPVSGRADVVVVGAGFTGLSAALALARRGASVTVLEAGRVIGEASGRNGGHCNSGTAHDFATLAGRLGTDKARAFYQAFAAAVDTVETVVKQEDIACDFVRTGKLKLASKPAALRQAGAFLRAAAPRSRSARRDGAGGRHPGRSRLRQILRRPAAEDQCADAHGQVRCRARARCCATRCTHRRTCAGDPAGPPVRRQLPRDQCTRNHRCRAGAAGDGESSHGPVLVPAPSHGVGRRFHHCDRAAGCRAGATPAAASPHLRHTRRTSSTTFASRPTTAWCSAGARVLPCPIRARTRRADASCAPRWKSSSPSCAACASTTVGAGWST